MLSRPGWSDGQDSKCHFPNPVQPEVGRIPDVGNGLAPGPGPGFRVELEPGDPTSVNLNGSPSRPARVKRLGHPSPYSAAQRLPGPGRRLRLGPHARTPRRGWHQHSTPRATQPGDHRTRTRPAPLAPTLNLRYQEFGKVRNMDKRHWHRDWQHRHCFLSESESESGPGGRAANRRRDWHFVDRGCHGSEG
jgi:hypothetical protein